MNLMFDLVLLVLAIILFEKNGQKTDPIDDQHNQPYQRMTKIVAVSAAAFAIYYLGDLLRLSWLNSLAVLISLFPSIRMLVDMVQTTIDQQVLDREISGFLEAMIIHIQGGRSVQLAYRMSLERLGPARAGQVDKILTSGSRISAGKLWRAEYLRSGLKEIETGGGSNHLDKLQLVQAKIRFRQSMSERIGAVTYQAKAQWGLVTLLYLALLLFCLKQPKMITTWFVPVSLVLFLVGSGLFWTQVRGFRWRI